MRCVRSYSAMANGADGANVDARCAPMCPFDAMQKFTQFYNAQDIHFNGHFLFVSISAIICTFAMNQMRAFKIFKIHNHTHTRTRSVHVVM